MEIFIQLLVFSVSIFFLVKSADIFVVNAEKMGKSLGFPSFITGVLVLSVGTSLPELATGIAAMLKNSPEIIIGNVLGSNIANVFLGIGLISFLAGKNIKFEQNIFKVHVPIYIIAISATVLTLLDGVIVWGEGLVLMLIGISYLWFLFENQKSSFLQMKGKFQWRYVFWILVSLAGVIVSSEITIRSTLQLSSLLGIGTTVLSASLIAIGTSLPEIVVGLMTIKKKNFDMLIGNILGSNIFNIVLVLGGGSVLSRFLGVEILSNAIITTVLIPFAIASAIILIGSGMDKEITKQEALSMVGIYILFLGMLFGVI